MQGAQFPQGPVGDDLVAAKRALRTHVLAARRELTAEAIAADAEALARHVVALPQVRAGACVAAYVSQGTEPGTAPLLEALHARGVRVLLPVLLADDDLDWAPYAPSAWRTGRRGLREPDTAPLGVEAVAAADLVVVPGLAVSLDGHRMGRGGGSYDRALARVAPDAVTVVLLHPGEVGLPVPVEEHDHPVTAAVTRDGVTRLR